MNLVVRENHLTKQFDIIAEPETKAKADAIALRFTLSETDPNVTYTALGD